MTNKEIRNKFLSTKVYLIGKEAHFEKKDMAWTSKLPIKQRNIIIKFLLFFERHKAIIPKIFKHEIYS